MSALSIIYRLFELRQPEGITQEEAEDQQLTTDAAHSASLSDTSVLDCTICFDPLTAPVYQCVNGHIACSLCCIKIKQKCPSCSRTIGHIRCRAFESVLESVMVPCSFKIYGCPEVLSYSSKRSHEAVCVYAPLGCPFVSCGFVGSHIRLSTHINQVHKKSVIPLRFDQICKFSRSVADKFVVFREEVGGTVFILNGKNKISCIYGSDVFVGDRLAYVVIFRGMNGCFRFQSLTTEFENVAAENGDTSLEVGDGIELCIWRKEAPSVDIAGDIVCGTHQT